MTRAVSGFISMSSEPHLLAGWLAELLGLKNTDAFIHVEMSQGVQSPGLCPFSSPFWHMKHTICIYRAGQTLSLYPLQGNISLFLSSSVTQEQRKIGILPIIKTIGEVIRVFHICELQVNMITIHTNVKYLHE